MKTLFTIAVWIAVIVAGVTLFQYIADHAVGTTDNVGWGIAKDNPIK